MESTFRTKYTSLFFIQRREELNYSQYSKCLKPIESQVQIQIMHDGLESNSEKKDRPPQLLAIELRVLGALMEKELTTPDAYPLTVNSIITACNQKSSRDPVTSYHQGEIRRALQELEDKHFVRREFGSRAEKFSQRFMDSLGLGKKQQAVLSVMMLRGPQTLSELNTRTQRMCEFSDKQELEHCVDRLCERDVPFAIRLGVQPGQRGERIGHLFSGMPTVAKSPVASSTAPQSEAAEPIPATTVHTQASAPELNSANTDEVELLREELASLRETVSKLKHELDDVKKMIQHTSNS
jgi:uncharacterized protein YceH (UPF0502 family)